MQNPIAPASLLRRLSNFLIDCFAYSALIIILLIAISQENLDKTIEGTIYIIIIVGGYFLYFVVCEGLWQKTLGKLITKTKVVDREGNKPSFLKILGRSIARYIPFEQFSFLFGSFPVGWHDSLSKTLVVPAHLTPEDVRKMDLQEIRKQNSNNVVVAIIIIIFGGFLMLAIMGIFSSVVLSSLSSAKHIAEKARDKAIMAQEQTAREISNSK